MMLAGMWGGSVVLYFFRLYLDFVAKPLLLLQIFGLYTPIGVFLETLIVGIFCTDCEWWFHIAK